MALPALTVEARAEALKKAAAVRKERGEVLAQLKDGEVSLKEALEREDTVVGKVYVRRLLESMPGIGKARAAQLLDALEISESRRVQGLGARQKGTPARTLHASGLTTANTKLPAGALCCPSTAPAARTGRSPRTGRPPQSGRSLPPTLRSPASSPARQLRTADAPSEARPHRTCALGAARRRSGGRTSRRDEEAPHVVAVLADLLRERDHPGHLVVVAVDIDHHRHHVPDPPPRHRGPVLHIAWSAARYRDCAHPKEQKAKASPSYEAVASPGHSGCPSGPQDQLIAPLTRIWVTPEADSTSTESHRSGLSTAPVLT